ncbi:MAG: HNH endonuclease signature motif containing protein, partial [Candidatus Nanopelagicales bacterium]
HVEAFTGTDDGGVTSADNLITLCRRHHRLKTHNHWQIRIVEPPDGGGVPVVEWTTARGLVFGRPRPSQLELDHDQVSDVRATLTPVEARLTRVIHAA